MFRYLESSGGPGVSAPSGRRRAGVLIPLFSCPSTASWGIGDIGDVAPVTAWLAGAGQRVLQLLPLNEMARGGTSPYSATSAMAIDPIFIRVTAVPEFAAIGGEVTLPSADRECLDEARRSSRVEYQPIRRLKDAVLAVAFERFSEEEWHRDTARARALRAFLASQAWWIDDYALFRAIHRREQDRPWTEWPEPLRRRDRDALERARQELSTDVLYHQYLQWLADSQWREARAAAAANGVELFGDLPFMVDRDSADVWARQDEFHLDVSVGAPPDAFSATGQDWGMPAYRWDAVAADDFGWLRDRARRTSDLYDGYRVDHLVGFYRTYGRPHDGREPFFTPAEEDRQLALGERVLTVLANLAWRSSPKISARCPISSARPSCGLAYPVFACSGGSVIGIGRVSPSAILANTLRSRLRRLELTTPSRWPAGGSTHRPMSGRR